MSSSDIRLLLCSTVNWCTSSSFLSALEYKHKTEVWLLDDDDIWRNDLQKVFNHDEHLTSHHHPKALFLIYEMSFLTQDCTWHSHPPVYTLLFIYDNNGDETRLKCAWILCSDSRRDETVLSDKGISQFYRSLAAQ